MMRDRQAGFTLIETLVALAVLAVSSVALLGAVQAHLGRIGALEYRVAALIAAQNYLAEVTLGLVPEGEAGAETGVGVSLLGIAFAVSATRQATGDPAVQRLEIAVADQVDGKVYARLTGFVADVATAEVAP